MDKITEKKSDKKNRIERYLREQLHNLTLEHRKPLEISIDELRNLIGSKTPYSTRDITRDFVNPIISKINEERINNDSSYSFPYTVKTYYSNSNKKEFLGYIFAANREYYVALRLDEYMRNRNKTQLLLPHNIFTKLLYTEHKKPGMYTAKYIEKNSAYNDSITDEKIHSFTFSYALPVLKCLNEIAAKNSSMPDCKTKYRYEMVEERRFSNPVSPSNKSKTYYLSYAFTKKEYQDDTFTASDIPNKHFYPLRNPDEVAYNSISKWAYLTHLYLLYAFNNSHATSTFINTNQKKTHCYIVELDAKSVWEFWHNSPVDKRFTTEFKKAVNMLNNMCINTTPPKKHFLLSSKDYNLIMENSATKPKTIIPYTVYPPDSTDNEKFLVYIKSNYATKFSLSKVEQKCPKKLIHLSPKTSYSQIRLFEFLHITFNGLKKNKDNTTDYSIPISNIAIITGKLDLASEHISKYIDENIYTTNNYNYLYDKIPDKERFTHDLIYFFLKPNLARFNEYKKGEGESQIINMSRSNDKDNHTVLSFSLVSIDKQP